MFKRRRQRTILERTREFIWPRAGVVRATKYLGHRLGRMKGTPYSIACGAACGASVSMLPLIGLHFVLGGLIAWLLKGNIIAAMIGTALGNPYSFPVIFWWGFTLGIWILGGSGQAGGVDFLAFATLFIDTLGDSLLGVIVMDFTLLGEDVWPRWRDAIWPVWYPMFVGGLPTALGVWVAVYVPTRRLIASYQRHRARKLVGRRQHRLGEAAHKAKRDAARALETARKAEEEAEAARAAARLAAERAVRIARRAELATQKDAREPIKPSGSAIDAVPANSAIDAVPADKEGKP